MGQSFLELPGGREGFKFDLNTTIKYEMYYLGSALSSNPGIASLCGADPKSYPPTRTRHLY